ncbi:MAG: GTPase domain-containing protein [Promethearchaeota archaeon]|jgi:small GTP-binding protein
MGKVSQFLKKLKKSKRLVRMTIVGDGAVGKTTLVQALIKKTAYDINKSNGGKILSNKEVKRTPFMEIETWAYNDLLFQCYDLAGQRTPGIHPLDIMRDQVTKSIDLYIFVFSVDRYESFENLNNWIHLMGLEGKYTNGHQGLILVGNKIDLENNISNEVIESVVGKEKYFQKYIKTCSLDGRGIDNLLEEITQLGKNILSNKD